MNKQEFEQLTGFGCTQEEFEEYEDMYMEAGDDIDKQTFCNDLKHHSDSVLIEAFFDKCNMYKIKIKALQIQQKEMIDFLIEEAHEMNSMKARNKAITMMGGRVPYLAEVMRRGYDLWEIDKTDLIDVLSNI